METSKNILQAENISKWIGELCLFQDISISIHENQKIALIARNGAGKTSILNVLAERDTPDTGKITKQNDLKIAYLPQNPEFNPQDSVLKAMIASSEKIANCIEFYQKALKTGHKKELGIAIEQMDLFHAWDSETQAKQILDKLSLPDFSQKVCELSGGQKKRLALASTLFQKSDLLILDEPTNHLDLTMIEWLEDYLTRSNCALFMVTHDRYFLDNVCDEILELEGGVLHTYKGNYGYFLEKRNERIQSMNSSIEKAKNLYSRELEWMRRMPQARGTKSKSRIDKFYEIKEVASQKSNESKVKLDVKMTRLGKKIIELQYINKSFDDKILIKDFQYKFIRGEKIGIIGPNGCGKTTFLNIITGNIKADSGKIETGETVKYGFYKQSGIHFNDDDRVIDVVKEIAELVILGDGRKMSITQFLNYFLFPPETHRNKISKLSGGEKRRLYLLTILMQNPNFLILDEPTNDLDIVTLNVLEEYLKIFSGCVLIVSHDRYFMDKIVDHIFSFEGNGVVRDFPGNYSQYREKKETLKRLKKKEVPPQSKSVVKKESKPLKVSFKHKHEFELLEKEIKQLNIDKQNLEALISSGSLDQEKLIEISTTLGKLIENLDLKETRWLELDELING